MILTQAILCILLKIQLEYGILQLHIYYKKDDILKKSNIPIYLIWTAFGLFIFYAMSMVFMYFDDFGFASLSYSYVHEGVSGQDFTIPQLIEYLTQIYLRWAGRVVFPGLKILMLSNIWIYRTVQSILVLITFIALHRFSAKEDKQDVATVVFTCSLYGLFSLEMFRNGFYWFSASAIFVLPLAFFLVGCLLMKHIEATRTRRPLYIILCSLCFLAASVSQETLSITLIAFLVVFCILYYTKHKKIRAYQIILLVTSLAGSAFLLLAPGNFRRFEHHAEEVYRSQIRRMAENLASMAIRYLNLRENGIFIFVFLSFICYLAYILWKKNKINKKLFLAIAPLTGIILASIAILFVLPPYNTGLVGLLRASMAVPFYTYCIAAGYLIVKYLVYLDDMYLTALFLGAAASQAAVILIAPYIVERVMIVFYIALFAIFIRVFSDMREAMPKKTVYTYVLLPILLISGVNMAHLTYGYSLNREVNLYNDRILRQAAYDARQGMDISAVSIMPMVNPRFAGDFPDFTIYWIRAFYDIPDHVLIVHPVYGAK